MKVNDLLKSNVTLAYFSFLITAIFFLWTGLIPAWGIWYSDHLPFRWQTERLLAGHLSLSTNVTGIDWDLTWSNGTVQQLWGIAVPFWRLPFEILAKAFGLEAFPDRLSLAFFMVIVAFFALKLFTKIVNSTPFHSPWILTGWIPLIYFPAFIALCSSRFLTYEEVIAYGYLFSLLLMVWTVSLWLKPTKLSALSLAFISGFAPLIRPTFGAYGLASFLIACLVLYKLRRNYLLPLSAAALYLIGGAVLLLSNQIRFGAGTEFGHSLAVNGMDSMIFVTHFTSPYRSEPIGSACRELFGQLFLSRFPDNDLSSEDIGYPWQSSTFRWREFYFSTYDFYSFVTLVTSYGWLMLGVVRQCQRRVFLEDLSPFEVMSLWSLLGFVPLLVFYLRFPFISSRYLLDFGPAIAVSATVFWALLIHWFSSKVGASLKWTHLAAIFLLGMWIYEVGTIKCAAPSHALSWEQVESRLESDAQRPEQDSIPQSYTNDFPFESTNIRFNGLGWYSKDGITQAIVVLFVSNPECLVLEVAPVNGQLCSTDYYNCIKAKIGLEYLKRKSITMLNDGGTRIVFNGPECKAYQAGPQMVSIAMMGVHELSEGNSRFLLKNVQWHQSLY